MSTERQPRARRLFGPAVLIGLASAGLAAVAASRPWVEVAGAHDGVPLDPAPGGSPLGAVSGSLAGSDVAPLASALALVALASWGAILVLRGGARRGAAVLGAAAAAGAIAASLSFDVASAGDATELALTVWPVVTVAALALTLAGLVAAIVYAPRWPAMSSRYDNPGGRAAESTAIDLEDEDPRAVWRALDEGDDPTE